MIVYFIVILVLIAMHNALHAEHNPKIRDKKEQRYLRISCAIFVILAALRYVIPESDIDSYMRWYQRIGTMSFDEVIVERDLSYTYFLSSKVFSMSGLPYQYWFGFVELFFISGYVRMMNKFTSDKIMAMFLFFTLGLYTFSFHGLKQIFAMAIIWHGCVDFYEKKFLRSGVAIVLAYFCHKTAMIFILAYIMPFLSRLKNTYYVLMITLCTVLIFSYSTVLTSLTEIMGDEHYMDYLDDKSGYSAATFIFYSIMLGIGFRNKGIKTKETTNQRASAGMAFISVFSQLFSLRVASAFRLSLYFVPFLGFYLANKISSDRNLQYIVFFIASIWLLYTNRETPYKFFWQ